MKKLFVKAIEWMMAAFKDTRCVYADARGASVATTNSSDFQRSVTLSPFNEDEEENFQKVKGDGVKVKEETLNTKLPTLNQAKLRLTIPEIEQLLRAKYDLRYNVLTEQSEYRVKGSGAAFEAVTQRVYKTWMADLQADGHNVWWIEGVRIAAESMHIEPYHPVKHYFATLPQWDGTDRLRPLMQRLTTDEVLVDYLCRWMLAFVAQAQDREEALYANSVAPILISEQQGWHKSTFCRMLMPPKLRMFYTDCFDLTAESQCEHRLTDCLLINLDEFDRYSARKQSTLKNLMQMRRQNPYLIRGVNAQNFGALLREWGFKRVEHHHRRMYQVVQIEN